MSNLTPKDKRLLRERVSSAKRDISTWTTAQKRFKPGTPPYTRMADMIAEAEQRKDNAEFALRRQ